MSIPEDDFNEAEMFPNAKRARVEAPVEASGFVPMTPTSNPLAGYFRMPGLTIKLPTRGKFFPRGTIILDEAGEVSVFPMKASDELLLSSPDALMNGEAIMNLIASCVPAIKRPDLVSAPDLDVLLLAVRAASNGPTMDMSADCPKCKHEMSFDVNLPSMLATMVEVPDENVVRISDDILVYMRPHSMAAQTKLLMSAFAEQRAAQALDLGNMSDEEKSRQMSAIMKRISLINIEGLSNSIIKIVVPDTEVTDRKFIGEYLANTDAKTISKLQSKLEEINTMGIDKKIELTCEKCSHVWSNDIEFNPATFFAPSS